MNEDEYRSTYHQVNSNRCVFEKMILLRYGNCRFNQKLLLAEREAMSCTNETARQGCVRFLHLLRDKARFALQLTRSQEPLPHTREIKVQAGGLYGLQQYLHQASTVDTTDLNDNKLKFDSEHSQPVKDIYATLQSAESAYGSADHFPYNELVKAIKHFSLPSRKRKSRKKAT